MSIESANVAWPSQNVAGLTLIVMIFSSSLLENQAIYTLVKTFNKISNTPQMGLKLKKDLNICNMRIFDVVKQFGADSSVVALFSAKLIECILLNILDKVFKQTFTLLQIYLKKQWIYLSNFLIGHVQVTEHFDS